MYSSTVQSQCDRTPIKQRLRKSYLSQTEKKVEKIKSRRLSSCNVPLNFTTTLPLVEKIKNKPLAQSIISPSVCFGSPQKQRLSKIGLRSSIILPSSQNDTNDDTSCDINECDVSNPGIDIKTKRYVVHPRFLNDSLDIHENSNSDGETEDLMNSTFTFLQNEENSSHVEEKGITIEDEPKVRDHHDGSNKRRTRDESENSIYNSLISEKNNFSSDSNGLVSSRNFNNITLRNHKSRSTFVSIDDSSNDADYHSPGKPRLTFDKSEEKLKDIEKNLNEDDTFASCYNNLAPNENDAAVVDDVPEPVNETDRRLTFDKDDTKGIKGSNETNSKKDSNRTIIQEAFPPSTTLEQARYHNVNFALENESKTPSIIKRLSKFKKAKNELGKLSSVSKTISRSSHLASFGRTPTISGSKAVQLYKFLSGDADKDNAGISEEPLILENTPPSSSSTPKILKKHVLNSLLKSTLKKQSNNVSVNDGKNNTSMTEKSVKLGKMPNFASLHKKQFEEMENISDYKQRKSERAKLLLSGFKPHNDTSLRPRNKKIVKTLLLDPPGHSELTEEAKANTNILLPDIVQSIRVDKKENSGEIEIPDNVPIRKGKKKVTIYVLPETPQKKLTAMAVVKTPYKINDSRERTLDEVELQQDMNKINSPQKTNAVAKNNNDKRKPLTNSSSSHQPKSKILVNNNSNITRTRPANSVKPAPAEHNTGKQGPIARSFNSKSAVADAQSKLRQTRFGFTVPVKIKKDEAVKAILNKSRISTSNQQDDKRAVIQGVRSNRRFDLLMKMRNKK